MSFSLTFLPCGVTPISPGRAPCLSEESGKGPQKWSFWLIRCVDWAGKHALTLFGGWGLGSLFSPPQKWFAGLPAAAAAAAFPGWKEPGSLFLPSPCFPSIFYGRCHGTQGDWRTAGGEERGGPCCSFQAPSLLHELINPLLLLQGGRWLAGRLWLLLLGGWFPSSASPTKGRGRERAAAAGVVFWSHLRRRENGFSWYIPGLSASPSGFNMVSMRKRKLQHCCDCSSEAGSILWSWWMWCVAVGIGSLLWVPTMTFIWAAAGKDGGRGGGGGGGKGEGVRWRVMKAEDGEGWRLIKNHLRKCGAWINLN